MSAILIVSGIILAISGYLYHSVIAFIVGIVCGGIGVTISFQKYIRDKDNSDDPDKGFSTAWRLSDDKEHRDARSDPSGSDD